MKIYRLHILLYKQINDVQNVALFIISFISIFSFFSSSPSGLNEISVQTEVLHLLVAVRFLPAFADVSDTDALPRYFDSPPVCTCFPRFLLLCLLPIKVVGEGIVFL